MWPEKKLAFGLLLGWMVHLAQSSCSPIVIKNASESPCAFKSTCMGVIRDVSLPAECQGSSNHHVSLDITIKKAYDASDERFFDGEVLKYITTLTINANWTITTLSILKHMPKLENLYLSGNSITLIKGAPFYKNDQLQQLDLSNNHLTDVTDIFTFESSNRLKKLSLAYNKIDFLDSDVFVELNSLVELDLSHNMLVDLSDEPFANITNLQILYLNDNKIKDLNGAVNNLIHLKHLYLKGNNLENIDDESVKIIFHLETFDLSKNKLYQMRPTILQRHWHHLDGKSVCKINLSHNQLTAIPNATKRFSRQLTEQNTAHVITHLDLSSNDISTVEYNAFHTIVHLTTLDLSSNKLIHFVVNEEDLTEIRVLNLGKNSLQYLSYESFSAMMNLINLDVSHNEMINFPFDSLKHHAQLRSVSLAFNKIEDIKDLHIRLFHQLGGSLDLSNNRITSITIPIDEGLHLKVLSLNNNFIEDLRSVSIYETSLLTLDLSHNYISSIYNDSMNLPYSLTTLILSFNAIQHIEAFSFRRLIYLHTLRLTHNKLTNIEFGAFNGLHSLKKLDLAHNTIHILDSLNMVDLKSLTDLSLNYNEMNYINYKHWTNHKNVLNVYVDGDNFTCDFVDRAFKDFSIGYTNMKLTANPIGKKIVHAVEGIPCLPSEVGEYAYPVTTDDRLVFLAKMILEAVKNQTEYLKNFLWTKNDARGIKLLPPNHS